MAGKPIDWPPDEELFATAEQVTSCAQIAKAHGIKPNTLTMRMHNDADFKAEINRRLRVTPLETPGEEPDAPEVLKSARLAEENRVLRADIKKLQKRLGHEGEFFDRIVEATRVSATKPRYAVKRQRDKKPANSVITPCYDQQFGQFVRPTDTPGNQGGFSVEVFDTRLKRWVEGVCGIIGKRAEGYRLQELFIPFGGDQVEGDEIFGGQAWQLELDPARQVWELAEKMDSAVRQIVKFAKEEVGIPKIACYGVTGNHGKVGGKRGGARPATYSWDWLFLKILFDRLRAEPIDQFAIEPGGSLFFRAGGHEFQAVHGDEIRGWGGLPFYGLTRFDGRSIRLHGRIYRYLIMGHHHQPAEIPNGAGETIVSGDWVGANNLSKFIAAASRPQQKVLFVSEKWGIDGTERIYFAQADEAYAPTAVHDLAA